MISVCHASGKALEALSQFAQMSVYQDIGKRGGGDGSGEVVIHRTNPSPSPLFRDQYTFVAELEYRFVIIEPLETLIRNIAN